MNLTAPAIETAMFRPRSLEAPESWIGLIPFAAWWLRMTRPQVFVELGTHTGNSYFACCQAVETYGLSTKCFAIDTWQGDEHAGFYGDGVFEPVEAHNNEHYSNFSQLLRMKFDDALHQFEDNTIDLLHIDGLHSYEAVRHDFETWWPKLAHNATVMFHDISVQERGFGVWQFWDELKAEYPVHSQLDFSNGLGILCIEKTNKKLQVNDEMKRLLDELTALKCYFEVLGEATLQSYRLKYARQEIAHRQSLIDQIQANSNSQILYRDDLLVHTRAELAAVNQNANAQISYRDDLLAHTRAELAAVNQNANAQILYRDQQIQSIRSDLQEVQDKIKSKKQLLKLLFQSFFSSHRKI
jgi:O-antigen biosynthesis protein